MCLRRWEMARRVVRTSRGNPMMSSPEQQRTLLRLMDSDPDLMDAISTFVGEDLRQMGKQDRLAAYRSYEKAGPALATIVMTARLRREAIEEATFMRGEVDRADRIVLLEAEVAELRGKLDRKASRR